jgi:hypothetical protein
LTKRRRREEEFVAGEDVSEGGGGGAEGEEGAKAVRRDDTVATRISCRKFSIFMIICGTRFDKELLAYRLMVTKVSGSKFFWR